MGYDAVGGMTSPNMAAKMASIMEFLKKIVRMWPNATEFDNVMLLGTKSIYHVNFHKRIIAWKFHWELLIYI